jgi:L-threonylcarbamoyladenylate synthase
MTKMYKNFSDVADVQEGAIFACPTDTVYGLSCLAVDGGAVVRIKEAKGRSKDMPFIVLISDLAQLDMFLENDAPSRHVLEDRVLSAVWPGPVSIVFSHVQPRWSLLSLDGTLALRMPRRSDMRAFIYAHGPIISTSANLNGKVPATTANEVLHYFPSELDFVIDTGDCVHQPSTVIKILR